MFTYIYLKYQRNVQMLLTQRIIHGTGTVDGYWDVQKLMNDEINCLSTGAGFLPSTVV